MTMRCVSKCFIGRPFRVYTLLFLGMTAGFAISTVLQGISYEALLQKTSGRMNKFVDYQQIEQSRTGFDNLDGDMDPRIDIGADYYDYERMMGEQEAVQGTTAGKGEPTASLVMEDSRLRQGEYINRNWQGRNVRETSDGAPVVRLTDAVAPRQTVLIAVITTVTQLMSQTLAIQGTWGSDAKQVIYFTGEVQTMPHLPHGMVVVQLEGIDDKTANWEVKEFSVVKYLIEHYLDTVDWFLLVSDEAYVVPTSLEQALNTLDGSMSVYMGQPDDSGKEEEGERMCRPNPGVVYSHGLLERLKPYLPLCWPGHGEMKSLTGCISVMGLKCSHAQESQQLFVSNAKSQVESSNLFRSSELTKALVVHPVKYPKYMYRLHSYYKELEFNASVLRAKSLANLIKETHPFIPSHLRSPYQPGKEFETTPPLSSTLPTTSTSSPPPSQDGGVIIRPRYTPKNKFEVNYWEYFNQTRLMSIMHESPARGIIGGVREEARYALTKAIYMANQGLPPNQRYIFDKLENGYHRVDPMRGSEFILDFVFRRSSDRNTRIRKRISILRPFHESIMPVDSPEMLPTVNFITVLSGLSARLEHFLINYEMNVLQLGQDATLTIVLFDSPDATKVRLMVQQYMSRYQGAKIYVVDAPGEFARGNGLHRGTEGFHDDQLLFFVDVDLDISTNFLQRCRLNSVRGKQVYFPVFFKLYKPDFIDKWHRGNSSMVLSRHNGHWAHYSYGMLCIFASDYRQVGGFNLNMQGWGEEDVDLFNRVLKHDLEAFRAPDPGMIHNWHSKHCDKSTVKNVAAYEHCLQSKGENLADRVELAQYVFENELRKGNLM